MKILHVSESISSLAGGLQFTATGLAETFKSKGHDVLFVAGEDEGLVNQLSVDIVLLKKIGPPKLKILSGLHEVISSFKPDIIIQHGVWSPFNFQITRASKKLKIDYIIVPHGMLDTYIINKNRFLKSVYLFLFQKNNLKNAKFIRALNENEKSHIENIIDTVRVVIAPNGIVTRPDTRRISFSERQNKVIFLGRIDHKKSVLELCEAWIELKKDHSIPECAELSIAGWYSDIEYFNKVNDTINPDFRMHYVGPKYKKDKDLFFESGGLFILPSKGEGLPTVVLEAWNSNCIVSMSKECNFPKENYGTACIETSAHIEDIKKSIVRYFEMNENDIDKMLAASKVELDCYGWPSIADRILEAVYGKR